MLRILYIDDDAGIGRLLQKALVKRDIDVCHVMGGDDGLLRLAGETFDLIALDHDLRSETGLDLIPRIRSLPDAPPIIYVTGSDNVGIAVAALKAGAVDYVWKDVEGHYRELIVQAILAAHQVEKQRRDRAEAQRQIAEAKDRAELLLSEVNHRVANSLALVASMARMQANALNDQAARDALQEMQGRIGAIAGVHRRLYTSLDVRIVDVEVYLEGLVEELAASLNGTGHLCDIQLIVEGQVQVSPDRAISLGIIVTELVTNSCKYAYPPNVNGSIRVVLRRVARDRAILAVEDDGTGWSGTGAPKGTGLGARILRATAARLDATLNYDSGHRGTRAVLDFFL